MQKDSIANTFIVAGGVCLVCSLLVSSAAVLLKPRQDANVLLDRKMNILLATGDFKKEDLSEKSINDIFSDSIEDRIIDLATGEDVTDEFGDSEQVASYDQFKASKKKDRENTFSADLDRKLDIAQIKRLENRSHVYIYTTKAGEKVYIFPIRGYGLWSTLKGFIALKSDLRTIAGLTYYEHKETPGLGGEVDNPAWKAKWTQGKFITDESGEIRISVVSPESDKKYKVDALSGATITSRGVENMIRFWMGDQGFGSYLDRLRTESPEKSIGEQAASQVGEDKNG